jgi:enamine deaminase RidA (YjgF/YER057c/UK114 family)
MTNTINARREAFGDIGRHARAAVGAAKLPRNVAVELDVIFEVAPE